MAVVFTDLSTEVEIPENGTLSRVIHQDERVRLIIFAFDAGQELSPHRSASAAVVQVVKGRLQFQAGGQSHELTPGSWLHMDPGQEHALAATEPTIMLLTLLRGGSATPETQSPPNLVGRWQVIEIGGAKAQAPAPELAFEADGVVTGTTGINRFRSEYQLTDDKLGPIQAATTRMGGPPELMDQEHRFVGALAAGGDLRSDGDQVVVGAGEGSLRLSPLDPSPHPVED